MEFDMQKDQSSIIKVIGVGGGGGNAVTHMYNEGIKGVDFIICNTDQQALDVSTVPHKIQLGASLTEGRGADYVFVTVGDKNAIEQGFKILGRGGTLVIVGMTADGVKVEFDSCKFAGIEQNMLGSKMGSTRLVTDIPWYISMYQQGRLKLDELITGRYQLAEINKAIADVRRSDTLRNVIVF